MDFNNSYYFNASNILSDASIYNATNLINNQVSNLNNNFQGTNVSLLNNNKISTNVGEGHNTKLSNAPNFINYNINITNNFNNSNFGVINNNYCSNPFIRSNNKNYSVLSNNKYQCNNHFNSVLYSNNNTSLFNGLNQPSKVCLNYDTNISMINNISKNPNYSNLSAFSSFNNNYTNITNQQLNNNVYFSKNETITFDNKENNNKIIKGRKNELKNSSDNNCNNGRKCIKGNKDEYCYRFNSLDKNDGNITTELINLQMIYENMKNIIENKSDVNMKKECNNNKDNSNNNNNIINDDNFIDIGEIDLLKEFTSLNFKPFNDDNNKKIPIKLLNSDDYVAVNNKQYQMILKRRKMREALLNKNKLRNKGGKFATQRNIEDKNMKKYKFESRHKHAVKRERGKCGRFLSKKPKEQP